MSRILTTSVRTSDATTARAWFFRLLERACALEDGLLPLCLVQTTDIGQIVASAVRGRGLFGRDRGRRCDSSGTMRRLRLLRHMRREQALR